MSTGNRIDPERTAQSLHAAAIHLLRKFRRIDNASGLNPPRLSALSVVVFAGPLTLGQLAKTEQVRPPTMTRIVHALEAQGLVTRGVNADDRRTIHLSATMKGKRLLLQARHRRVASLAHQVDILPDRDRKALQAAISIIDNLLRSI
jgi:DNA-binding MarR family transcriptional regulator